MSWHCRHKCHKYVCEMHRHDVLELHDAVTCPRLNHAVTDHPPSMGCIPACRGVRLQYAAALLLVSLYAYWCPVPIDGVVHRHTCSPCCLFIAASPSHCIFFSLIATSHTNICSFLIFPTRNSTFFLLHFAAHCTFIFYCDAFIVLSHYPMFIFTVNNHNSFRDSSFLRLNFQ